MGGRGNEIRRVEASKKGGGGERPSEFQSVADAAPPPLLRQGQHRDLEWENE